MLDVHEGLLLIVVPRTGIEPVSTAPETIALSIRPPGRCLIREYESKDQVFSNQSK